MRVVDNSPQPGLLGSAVRAYRMAGLGPDDVDVAEVGDVFPITAPFRREAPGFRGPGEGPDLLADGRPRPGRTLPSNPNGGGLRYGHPGLGGLLLLVGALRQVHGERGDRQAADPSAAVAHGSGGIFPTRATVLSGRDG